MLTSIHHLSLSAHLVPITPGGKLFGTDDGLHFLVVARPNRVKQFVVQISTLLAEHHHILTRLDEVVAW